MNPLVTLEDLRGSGGSAGGPGWAGAALECGGPYSNKQVCSHHNKRCRRGFSRKMDWIGFGFILLPHTASNLD